VQLKNVELVRLGRRIRRARKLLGFTQKSFATKCGLDRSYLGGVERGGRNVTFGVLCTICDGLSCDIAAVSKGIPHADRRASDVGSSRPGIRPDSKWIDVVV
jgi:transcriptional regulator with XRE-family HTH domain